MKKNKFIFICFMIAIISAIIFYNNSEEIISYFENKEWEIADSIGSVSINNYTEMESTLSNLVIVGTNYIKGYSNEGEEEFDLFLPFKDVISHSVGDYCIIGERDGTNIYMICGNQKVWESQIVGNIYDVYVNKNGYSAVIYKQSGYKSLIKVITPEGEELFTSYLASTYALDVAITNDNKTLAIAEVDTDGIHIVSKIKIIDINNLGNENVMKIDLEENSLIVDIEYNEKNELLIRTDSKIFVVNDKKINKLLEYDYSNTINATIENRKNIITVIKEEKGLFDVKYKLCIYSNEEELKKEEFELYDLPKQIKVLDDTVAIVMENELLVINTKGKLLKKCDISRNIKSVVVYDKGKTIGLVFRDKIEFIKI